MRPRAMRPAAPAIGPRGLLLALMAAQICLHGAMAGIRLALPLLVLRQGARYGVPAEMAAGVLLGLFAAVPVLTAMQAGRWTDRRGYHRPVHCAAGLLMAGAAVAVLATASTGWGAHPDLAAADPPWRVALQAVLLVVAAALVGTGCNAGLIAMQRCAPLAARWGRAPGQAPEAGELQRAFSWTGMAPSVSNSLGPLLAGLLIDGAGFPAACAVLGLAPLGTLLASARVPRAMAPGTAEAARTAAAAVPAVLVVPTDPAPAPAAAAAPHGPRLSVRGLLAMPGVPGILLVNWFFSGSWDLHAFLGPLLGTQLGLSATAIGAVMGCFAASVTLVRLLSPTIARRWDEATVLTTALALVAAVFAVYPWAVGAWSMGACATALGLALGVAQPMILSTLHQLAPAGQEGEVIALRSAVINLSGTLLPMVFGVLGNALGVAVLFRGMAVVLLLNLGQPRRLARVIAATRVKSAAQADAGARPDR